MNLNPNNLDAQIPMKFLEDLIGNMNLEKMNMWEIVQQVYTATYVKYSGKFWEEKTLREKVEKKILEKNEEIDKLHLRIKELEDEGASVPEESEGETQENS